MAKDREIPIVSAMQLNREATVRIEQGADNIEDYLKGMRTVGASNIAESLKLIQLVDMAIMVDRRKSETPGEADILTFRIVKSRVELEGINPTRLQTHCFLKENGIRLEEDIYDAVSKSIPYIKTDGDTERGVSAPKINPRRN